MVALGVALCVAAGPLEALIPDAHDGDSESTVTITAASDVRSAEVSPSEFVNRSAGQMGATTSSSPDGHRSTPVHAVHVDHCSHNHLVAVVRPSPLATPVSPDRQRAQLAALALPSIALSPGLRPPIA